MKQTKFGFKLFTALFLLLCLIPGVGLILKGEPEAAGNEHLSPKPCLVYADGALNKTYLNEFSSYFADNFAYRHELITLNSTLLDSVFGVSGNNTVLSGRDGWLFYTDTVKDYTGSGVLSDGQIRSVVRTLELMQEYCSERGARLLFTVAPNKASLYPQYMPGRYPLRSGENNAELLAAALRESDIPYADLFAAFRNTGETLYYETDSHWNGKGAALAADTLLRVLGMPEKAVYYGGAFEDGEAHYGDLYRMLYPAGSYSENTLAYAKGFAFSYDAMFRSADDISIYTENSAESGKLLMFRDSFGASLHSYMADCYGSAVFSRLMPYDLNLVDREQPDTVVLELVERNIGWLSTRAPVFAAPQRNIRLPDAEKNPEASVICLDSESMVGYAEIRGNIDFTEIDDGSRIYVAAGGTVYEASPAGEGVNPFTLYVPSESLSEGYIIVAAECGGTLKGFRIEL